jgi:lysozyme family protein
MADFKNAFQKTMGHEGNYVHDPDDPGGETYKGIARRFNPGWKGWSTIDALKDSNGFPGNLNSDPELQAEVETFYKQHYWDKFWGDDIPDQGLSNELFDTGVNMGVNRAVEFLQQGLNALNRNEKNYLDIVVDGGFGPKTLEALASYLSKDQPGYLFKIMNILQGMHYLNRMKQSPTQEKYARGWLNRVTFNKL